MTWLDAASRRSVVETAKSLGFPVGTHASSFSTRCPACRAERRHTKAGDKRGAVGIPKGSPDHWRCFQCDAHGDAADFAAWHIGGARLRDLPKDRWDAIRDVLGLPADYQPLAMPAARPVRPVEALENAETSYPSAADVERLWEACTPVTDDAAVLAYLALRDIPGARLLAEHDCCRALPVGAWLPAWATFGGRGWDRTGHRLIVPLYDWHGRLTSVLARSIDRAAQVKSVGAAGYGRRGLVMAGTYGRQVLESGPHMWWHRLEQLRVTVFEGEIDGLRAIARGEDGELTDNHELAGWRVVFGIYSGGFTRDVASRIPSKSTVVLATDDDEAGDKYAAEIRERIGERCAYERVRVQDDSAQRRTA